MNPAVKKLFEAVDNPILVSACLAALARREPIDTDTLPADLVEPLFILSTVAKEMNGAAVVINPAALRLRAKEDADVCIHHNLTNALLDGAGFNSEPRKFSEAATRNCEPGEVQLEYLPDGARFRVGMRHAQLIYRTPSRAVIEISGAKQERNFTNHRTGEDVTITASGTVRTGCSLQTPVVPLYTSVNHEDRMWAVNAWKEIAGIFDEQEKPKRKKGKP